MIGKGMIDTGETIVETEIVAALIRIADARGLANGVKQMIIKACRITQYPLQ
jgi:hypothetical protein